MFRNIRVSTDPVLRAVVNVRPHSGNININPNSDKLIRVAILGTNSFDTSIVDPASVRFGPNQVAADGRSRLRDVNGDGLLDLVLRFRIHGSGIRCNDSFVSISGQTVNGEHNSGNRYHARCGIMKRGSWITGRLAETSARGTGRVHEWTADGHLRHSSFVGLRDDKKASAVRRE